MQVNGHSCSQPDEQVQCRHDWYQQAASIIVSVYAKKVKKEESKVEFESDAVKTNF